MRVFVTGATGFIGSAIVQELMGAGHQVLGLTRSDAGAKWLADTGAEVHRGDLDNLESLRSGAEKSDGVIHCAFNHDFSKFVANCEADRAAIEALGTGLIGSDKPLVITSGTGHNSSGQPRTEEDALVPSSVNPRGASEEAGLSVLAKGVNVSVMRLPQVHNREKAGLITYIKALAQEKGVSAYIGDGLNRWPAVHLLDTAHLYRLALEKGRAGSRYHAVGEEGVSFRKIAEAIGKKMNIPVVSKSSEEAGAHFSWLNLFAALDMPASSTLTQERLGWHPTRISLLEDLES